jgi:hypothetical protein
VNNVSRPDFAADEVYAAAMDGDIIHLSNVEDPATSTRRTGRTPTSAHAFSRPAHSE